MPTKATLAAFRDRYPRTYTLELERALTCMTAALTEGNCVFLCGHSFNVYRKLHTGKTWEGQGRHTRAKYLAYTSVVADTTTPKWRSMPEITPSSTHILARILSQTSPGREKFAVDWNLDMVFQIEPPIYVPGGIGQGPRFPNLKNKHLHEAFRVLKALKLKL